MRPVGVVPTIRGAVGVRRFDMISWAGYRCATGSPAPAAARSPSMSPPAPDVLVVDDNSATAQSLADFLRAEGFNVRVAITAADTLAALAESIPDAAIVDLDGPDRLAPA